MWPRRDRGDRDAQTASAEPRAVGDERSVDVHTAALPPSSAEPTATKPRPPTVTPFIRASANEASREAAVQARPSVDHQAAARVEPDESRTDPTATSRDGPAAREATDPPSNAASSGSGVQVVPSGDVHRTAWCSLGVGSTSPPAT
jgi:hypothetical protein